VFLVLNSLNVRFNYSFFRYPYFCLYPISFEQVVKKGAKLSASQRNVEAFLTRAQLSIRLDPPATSSYCSTHVLLGETRGWSRDLHSSLVLSPTWASLSRPLCFRVEGIPCEFFIESISTEVAYKNKLTNVPALFILPRCH